MEMQEIFDALVIKRDEATSTFSMLSDSFQKREKLPENFESWKDVEVAASILEFKINDLSNAIETLFEWL